MSFWSNAKSASPERMSWTFATEPPDDSTVARRLRTFASEVIREMAPAIG